MSTENRFGNFTIYGTKERPLFLMSDVRQALSICRLHLDRYEEDIDYIRMQLHCKDGGIRDRVVLTEQGLYNVIFSSKSSFGREFRKFISNKLVDMRKSNQIEIEQKLVELAEIPKNIDDLYLISDGEWTKVGRSENVNDRLQNLQTGNPRPLTLIRVFPKMGRYERQVHEQAGLMAERFHEWFKLGNKVAHLIDIIEQIKDQN